MLPIKDTMYTSRGTDQSTIIAERSAAQITHFFGTNLDQKKFSKENSNSAVYLFSFSFCRELYKKISLASTKLAEKISKLKTYDVEEIKVLGLLLGEPSEDWSKWKKSSQVTAFYLEKKIRTGLEFLDQTGFLAKAGITYYPKSPLTTYRVLQSYLDGMNESQQKIFFMNLRLGMHQYDFKSLEKEKKVLESLFLLGALTPYEVFGHALAWNKYDIAIFALETTLCKPDGFEKTLKGNPLAYLKLAFCLEKFSPTAFQEILSRLIKRVTNEKELLSLYQVVLQTPASKEKTEVVYDEKGKCQIVRNITKEDLAAFEEAIQTQYFSLFNKHLVPSMLEQQQR